MKSSYFIFLVCAFKLQFSCLEVFSQSKSNSGASVEIIEAKWINATEDAESQDPLEASEGHQPVLFWAKLLGNSAAMRSMKEVQEIPIQIKIFKNTGIELTPERFFSVGSDLIDGEGSKGAAIDMNLLAAKEREMKSSRTGQFEFTLWVKILPDRLKGVRSLNATLVLNDNSRIRCTVADCVYQLNIK